ncbi:MAG: 1-acyl-sn-glycerol-3-phosphate acyltransferase [Marinicellaceae bacterium]
MIRAFFRKCLNIFGWKTIYNLPKEKRYVVIAAPHTSNWDFPLGMCYILSAGVPFRYMGKSALFKWPQKYLFKALGGIGVDRNNKTKLTTRMADFINTQEKIALALSPEGTRSKLDYWRTGFYYIALEAKVPIALAALDYGKREIGVLTQFMPSGDIEADFKIIRDFYKDIKGKHPSKQGPIAIKPK